MPKSALEKEIADIILGSRSWFLRHDRFVVITFLMSFIPLFIAPLISLFLSIFQLRLVRKGNLSVEERPLLQKSLIIAITNISLSILIAKHIYATGILDKLIELTRENRLFPLFWLFNFLKEIFSEVTRNANHVV